jgi:quercetin dioxygenase-like cupin family protein
LTILSIAARALGEEVVDMLIRKQEAPRFSLEGVEVFGHASPSRGSPAISLWRLVLAAGAQSPAHALTEGEIFVCLAGEAWFELAGDQLRLGPGDSLAIPGGAVFRIHNRSAAPFEALACMPATGQAIVEGGAPFTPPWAA